MSVFRVTCAVFLLTSVLITPSEAASNNACPRFEDYANISVNENCFHDPDMEMPTPDLIKKYMGECETHRVVTEDGYILQMFRIPRKNPKGVILLQHGLGADSRFWVGQNHDSLAFFLWNAGYDIWISNQRGTLFSKEHKLLSNADHKYWDFSFHEIGYYDIPAQINTIKKYTKRKIIFIGHSQGTAAALIYGSLRPEEAQNSVETFVFIGTSAILKHSTSILTNLVPYRAQIEGLVKNLRLNNVLAFMPSESFIKASMTVFPFLPTLFNLVLSAVFGWTPEETDPAIFNFGVNTFLGDISFKNWIHYIQLMEVKTRFQMFDYGERGNLQRYNSKTPPAYPLEKFSVPVFFISAEKDSLTTMQDTELLMDMLQTKIYGHLKLPIINHIQYFFGKHRRIYYEELLKFLDAVSN